ncbi:M48 family metallopeptidase [Nonomuraea sp. NPDC003804]|uniref:M48 family metallopeptidase n=1 Tax=Nonomuraea sp. NPDC003804 TaxID=3154547 RepID=UPI0033A630EE
MRRIAALVLSLAVHALTLGFVVLGVSIILNGPTRIVSWLMGAVLVGIGVLLRPRLARLPADAEVLDRDAAPALYGLAERVADEVGVARPAQVAVLDLATVASCPRIGLRRTPTLVIGLPLWLALSPRQRVTVVAGAYAAAETLDGPIVEGALSTLGEWRHTLLGSEPLSARTEADVAMAFTLGAWAPSSSYNVAGMLGRTVGRIFGWPVLAAEHLLRWLIRSGDPRAAERRRAITLRAVTEKDLTELQELIAGRSYLAPMQAAVLRGESVEQIRQAALTRARLSDDGVLTSAPGSRLLGAAESAVIDTELAGHYVRAARGFGLIS